MLGKDGLDRAGRGPAWHGTWLGNARHVVAWPGMAWNWARPGTARFGEERGLARRALAGRGAARNMDKHAKRSL